MENLTKNIAEKIGSELGLDNDSKEVIAYGTFAILQTLLSIAVTVLLGYTFDILAETLIVSFTISILRKYSGGANASSPGICAAISAVIAVGLALLAAFIITPIINLNLFILLGLLSFSWSFFIIYKLCPVDSAAKPIKSQKKKERMKKASILILCFYAVIVLLSSIIYLHTHEIKFLTYSLSIYGGTVWQSFTLTRRGHITILKIDTFTHIILDSIRRRK
ncbi:MAG: accessory gene regulator B family protein [Bacillota bacterium]|nr:accessory gene regulator B family protein [Bacillota bacterium]